MPTLPPTLPLSPVTPRRSNIGPIPRSPGAAHRGPGWRAVAGVSLCLAVCALGASPDGKETDPAIARTKPGTAAVASAVRSERVPQNGLQPQVVTGPDGVVHLVYFKGDPKGGNLFYSRREPGSTNWSTPILINSQPGSAIALGTIRGPQVALGRAGRIHVAWNGSANALPKGPEGSPMLYTRLQDDRTAFEPQRNLMTRTRHLDGGGSVAADATGNVYVVFHATPLEGPADESTRAVHIARSTDDGATFSAEAPATREPTGACGCCGLKAFAPQPGSLHIAYRAARERKHRDMTLLASRDAGATFAVSLLGRWEGTTCPMSSTALATDGRRLHGAWEIGSEVALGAVDLESGRSLLPVTPDGLGPAGGPGVVKRRLPTLAVNRSGTTLLAWTEGTGWNKGGSVVWQTFDADHRPIGPASRLTGLPAWSFAAAWAEPDGSFIVVY